MCDPNEYGDTKAETFKRGGGAQKNGQKGWNVNIFEMTWSRLEVKE